MTSTTTVQEDTIVSRSARRAGRFWEIDALRGVAIITMIVYHLMWDLWYWGVLPNVVLWEGFWKYWQRFTCGTFLILVGVSMTIVYRRERSRPRAQCAHLPQVLLARPQDFRAGHDHYGRGLGGKRRLCRLWHPAPDRHCDDRVVPAAAFQMAQPGAVGALLAGRQVDRAAALGWHVVHPALRQLVGRADLYLRPVAGALGITPTRYPAVDFFPIIPWLGVVLLGVFFGNLLYSENVRRFPLPNWGDIFPFNALEFLDAIHS